MLALAGTTYVSTEVAGRDLVSGTSVRLGFESSTMSVHGGCNTMGGGYRVTDGILAWTGAPFSTMMACSAELSAQDRWLCELFTSGVAAAFDESALVLSAGDVRIRLEPSGDPADPLEVS